MPLNRFNYPRLTHAYKMMAEKAKYRPGAPSDGLGNIELDSAEIGDRYRFAVEAEEYAERFLRQEDTGKFIIGVSNGSSLIALVYAIEAARLLCAGADAEDTAIKLLELALDEMKSPDRRKSDRFKDDEG